jgi:hypothetical protein
MSVTCGHSPRCSGQSIQLTVQIENKQGRPPTGPRLFPAQPAP